MRSLYSRALTTLKSDMPLQRYSPTKLAKTGKLWWLYVLYRQWRDATTPKERGHHNSGYQTKIESIREEDFYSVRNYTYVTHMFGTVFPGFRYLLCEFSKPESVTLRIFFEKAARRLWCTVNSFRIP